LGTTKTKKKCSVPQYLSNKVLEGRFFMGTKFLIINALKLSIITVIKAGTHIFGKG
jgi:hypothetical protein